jgi:hypothetical protein
MRSRIDHAHGGQLHAVVAALAARRWDVLVDVDAGDGAHASLLACDAPGAIVHAFESDEDARAALRITAEASGVAGRLGIAAAWRPEELDALLYGRSLVLCHGESVAMSLLDLAAVPALGRATVAVALRNGPDRAGAVHRTLAATHALDLADAQPGGWAVWQPFSL